MPERQINVISSGRRAGKTTWLVNWVRAGRERDYGWPCSRVMLVHNEQMRSQIIKQFGLSECQVQVFDVWVKRNQRGVEMDVEVGIDEAGLILQHMLTHRLANLTITTSQPCLCDHQ